MKEVVKNIFEAKTYAVIGVSRDEKKVGHIIFKNLLKSNKKVIGINPNTKKILNQEIFPDLIETPYNIDVIIIASPAKTIPLILRQAGKRKIKYALIISAGFSESNNKELEEHIKRVAIEENIRILGPNSFGIIDTYQNLNTTFYSGNLNKGNIGFISQSGAIASAMLDKINSFSKFASLGNSIDINFNHLIDYLIYDDTTKIICLYIESLQKNTGREFIEICKKSKKPIIVLKGGNSKSGQSAAKSHTAALAIDSNIYQGAFKQAKLIQVNSVTEMFNVARILEKYSTINKNTTIITNAGGFGVLSADYCEEYGIPLTKLSQKTIESLNKILPSNWSKNNPIDIVGDATPEDYKKVLNIIEKDKETENIILILTPQHTSQPEKVASILNTIKKPLFTCFIGGEKINEANKIIQKNKIINFSEPEQLCQTISKIIKS